jgi:hypothetical protein
MWWPSPQAIETELIVKTTEEGYEFMAPDNSECGEWIRYWNQTEAHREFFNAEYNRILLAALEKAEQREIE